MDKRALRRCEPPFFHKTEKTRAAQECLENKTKHNNNLDRLEDIFSQNCIEKD
jgi:hypothetical protein